LSHTLSPSYLSFPRISHLKNPANSRREFSLFFLSHLTFLNFVYLSFAPSRVLTCRNKRVHYQEDEERKVRIAELATPLLVAKMKKKTATNHRLPTSTFLTSATDKKGMARPTTTTTTAAVVPNKPFWGGIVSVDSPDIDSLRLVNPLPIWTRVYVLPWLYLYPLAYYAWLNYDTYIKSIGEFSTLL